MGPVAQGRTGRAGSYGSGAGSDAFVYTVQDRITEVQDLAPKTRWLLEENTIQVEYGEYAKLRRKIEPDPSNPCYIETLPGVGYMLSCPPDE